MLIKRFLPRKGILKIREMELNEIVMCVCVFVYNSK